MYNNHQPNAKGDAQNNKQSNMYNNHQSCIQGNVRNNQQPIHKYCLCHTNQVLCVTIYQNTISVRCD